jgi:hypothetical protein
LFIHRPKPLDKVVGRQLETLRPGEFGPNPSGFSFARWTNTGLAKPLDLAHQFPLAERFYLSKKSSKQRCFTYLWSGTGKKSSWSDPFKSESN